MLNVGMSDAEHKVATTNQFDQGLKPQTLDVFIDWSGEPRYSGVWSSRDPGGQSSFFRSMPAGYFETKLQHVVDLLDLTVAFRPAVDARAHLESRLVKTTADLEAHADDPGALDAWFWVATNLGRHEEVIARANRLLDRSKEPEAEFYYWRGLNAARLGRSEQAAADVAAYALHPKASDDNRAYLKVVTAVYRNDWPQVKLLFKAFMLEGRM